MATAPVKSARKAYDVTLKLKAVDFAEKESKEDAATLSRSEGYGSYVIEPGPVYNPVSFRAPGKNLAEGNRTPGLYSTIYGNSARVLPTVPTLT